MKHCNTVPHFWVFGLPPVENSCPNAIYFVRDGQSISMYTTDSNGVPFLIGSSNSVGNITLTSPNSTITIAGSGGNFLIDVSSTLISLINSAIQPGANTSLLVNDSGYLVLSDLDTINQDILDLKNNKFDNPSGDNTEYLDGAGVPTPFPTPPTGNTNLNYTPSPTNGVITSDTGTDATIPLADVTNAGLISPSEKADIASAVQPGDLATVATSGSYNDLADQPTIPDPADFLKLDGTSTMGVDAPINFANTSKLAEGSFDAGTGGNKGISLYCAVGYEWNFQAGEGYLVRLSDNKIRVKEYARSAPTVTDDSSKGYENGSVWNMVDHNEAYVCISETIGTAVWNLKEYTFDPATVDTNFVRNGITGWVEGYSKTQVDALLTPTSATFNGTNISLQKTAGTIYASYTQTTTVNFALDGTAVKGGWSSFKFIANGNPINMDAAWKNVGSDVPTATNGLVHRFFFYREDSEVWFTVKVG